MMAISKQTKKERRRTTSKYVYYSLQLYFSGLLLKNIIKAISLLKEIMFSIYLEQDPALQAEEDIANKLDANYLNLS
jgi:hypothetical protein